MNSNLNFLFISCFLFDFDICNFRFVIFDLFLPVKMNDNQAVAKHFKCTCEDETIIKSLNRLCSHVQYKHFERDVENNLFFACPDKNCAHKNIYGAQNIKRHFERNHSLDVNFAFLFDEPQSADTRPDLSENSLVQNCNQPPPLPDLDDTSSDVPMDFECTSTPVLLIDQQFNELRLEDRLCNQIIKHKKAFAGITTKACLDIAEDWRNFYSAYLDSGKITFNHFWFYSTSQTYKLINCFTELLLCRPNNHCSRLFAHNLQ